MKMNLNDDTGIGLTTFDRPEHTRSVLNSLEKNGVEHLYVFSDGPRTPNEASQVERTRDVVREVTSCDVTMVTHEENLGVKESFINAYDYIFEKHNKAILFEDDCRPSGDCIKYMQTCLDKYEDNENVMNVHGYGPPIDIPQTYNHDVYFTWRSGSWGQATWKTAWKKFKQDNTLMNRINTNPDFRHKVERAGNDLIPMLHQEINDEVDSGAVWWSLTLIRHEGVSINPVDSKVQNIGIDGTGVHSGSSNHYDVDVDPGADFQGIAFPPCVKVNETLNSRYNRFMTEGIRGRLRRWVNTNLRGIF